MQLEILLLNLSIFFLFFPFVIWKVAASFDSAMRIFNISELNFTVNNKMMLLLCSIGEDLQCASINSLSHHDCVFDGTNTIQA